MEKCQASGAVSKVHMMPGQHTLNETLNPKCNYYWTMPESDKMHTISILDRSTLSTENAILRRSAMDQINTLNDMGLDSFIAANYKEPWMIAILVFVALVSLCFCNCFGRGLHKCLCPDCTIRDLIIFTYKFIVCTLLHPMQWTKPDTKAKDEPKRRYEYGTGIEDDQPDSLRGLMEEIGRVYAPAQLANARAVQAGEKTWEAEIDGAQWTQRTFPYQAKCLRWTDERYRALSEADRASVDALLEGTGVETMLSLA